MKRLKIVVILFNIFFTTQFIKAQGFDNATRGLYILDISKYVQWNEAKFNKLADFNIGVLSSETNLYWELVNAAKTRQFVQQKPIKVKLFRNIESLEKVQVLFIGNPKEFNVIEVLQKIKGNNTLLISENCEFRLSMINFIVVDGKPRFEANEKLMNEEGMKVSQLFLAQAIKTREEWEQLYTKTDVELTKEKETVRQQNVVIDDQKKQIGEQAAEIENQKLQLEKLDDEITQKQKILSENISKLDLQYNFINNQKQIIENQRNEVSNQKNILLQQNQHITNQKAEIAQQENEIKQQGLVLADKLKLIEKQKLVLYFGLILILSISGLGYFIFRSYQIKKRANIALEEKNKTIMAQKTEIEQQRDLAQLQRDQITFQKRHITDSIEYAKRIQRAILPSLELFSDRLEHFVLYKPKDIVSGDFYWQTSTENELIIVTADCTGHGVPGAFMSMLGVSLLNDIVIKQGIRRPDLILNHLREDVIASLKQKERAELKDGMDITICQVNFSENKLYYAGANNPLYLVRNNDLTEIKGDKMPVAIYSIMEPFKLHKLDLQKGDTFYTSSDGFADQFGGPDNKKYLSRNFKNALLCLQQYPMLEQGEKLNEIFEEWRGEFEQLDDVAVIGIRY